MPVLFQELVAVEVFARGFAARREVEVVGPEASGVGRGEEAVEEHCEGDSVDVDGAGEGDVLDGGVTEAVT